MLKSICFFCLCGFSLFAKVDYDCVVVGTSPTSLFEAIYQTSLGKKVLVVERAAEYGGAWKSITICGIEHADMGCHEFGNTDALKTFLEEYAGCTIVSNRPKYRETQENWGIYPSRGCFELIHNLELLMKKLGTEVLLNTKLESVYLDMLAKEAEITLNGHRFRTSKLIVTNGADLHFENDEFKNHENPKKSYPHLYLLISDPTPSRFTYLNHLKQGTTRAMNITGYVGLEGSGMQLIAIQLQNENFFDTGENCLNEMKKKKLLDPSASIIQVEHYIYEQSSCSLESKIKNNQLIEFIPTGHIGLINNYTCKWKQAMRPWKDVMAAP